MQYARSGNSSEDELPALGGYRTDDPKREYHAGGVVDIRHKCGWCVWVSRTIPSNFRVRIKFMQQSFTGTGELSTDGPKGDCSMFGMLEGCGEGTGIVSVIVDPF